MFQAADAVRLAEWPLLEVHALNLEEKNNIVTTYLEGIYGKTLSTDQKEMIVSAPQTNNPLYLKALLDEVRI